MKILQKGFIQVEEDYIFIHSLNQMCFNKYLLLILHLVIILHIMALQSSIRAFNHNFKMLILVITKPICMVMIQFPIHLFFCYKI